jgi:hypothetical protein
MKTTVINIIDYIPYGKENAISRADLVTLTGLDDRTVRGAINRLRADGELILSSSHRAGYWRSDNPAEIESYLRECDSRCRTLAVTNRKMRQRLYEMTGQRYVVVNEHIRRIG